MLLFSPKSQTKKKKTNVSLRWQYKVDNFVGACANHTPLSFNALISSSAGTSVMQLLLLNKHFNQEMFAEISGKYAFKKSKKAGEKENDPTRFLGLIHSAKVIVHVYTELWTKVTENVALLTLEKIALDAATIANLIRAIEWHNTKWATPFLELPRRILETQAGETTPNCTVSHVIACLGTIAPQGINLCVVNETVQNWKAKMSRTLDPREADNFVSWRTDIKNLPGKNKVQTLAHEFKTKNLN